MYNKYSVQYSKQDTKKEIILFDKKLVSFRWLRVNCNKIDVTTVELLMIP